MVTVHNNTIQLISLFTLTIVNIFRTGKLKITAKDKLATIYLIDDQNKIFSTCPVTDDAAVERTLDSGM